MEQIFNRMLDEITALHMQLIEAEKKLKPVEEPYQSENVTELVTALAKAQGEYPPLCSDRQGYNFRYADLDMILLAIRPFLMKYGLSITQPTRTDADGKIILYSRLYHSSGQWIETRAQVVPEKAGLQAYGAAITYTRRYQLNTLLGVSVDKDKTDNDAQPTTRDDIEEEKKTPEEVYERPRSFECISKDQLDQIEYELRGHPKMAKQFMETMRIQNLCDLARSDFQSSLDKIREKKHLTSQSR